MLKFEPRSETWQYTRNHLTELRTNLVNELVSCDDHIGSSRIKGKIEVVDQLLELPTYVAGETSLRMLDE